MPKTRTAAKEPVRSQSLTLSEFTDRLAQKNGELLSGFLYGLESGELSLELDGAEEWLETTVDEWCEQEEPNRELHLRMISAVYVWMILDECYAEEVENGEAPANSQDDPRERVIKAVKLSVEVVKTVQHIWGIVNGKKA